MKTAILLSALISFSILSFAQQGKVHDEMEKKYGEPGAAKLEEWMSGKLMNVKIEPEYKFPVSMNMHNTSYTKGGKKEEMDMRYYLNTADNKIGVKMTGQRKNSEEMLIIYDTKANAMIMLNEAKKTGMAMSMNAFMSGEAIKKREEGGASPEGGKTTTSCKKTGKTRTIQGYSCEEYVCVDEEKKTRSEIWVTNKISADLSIASMRSPMAGYFGRTQGVGGMMMEASFYKEDKLEMTMQVTEINTSADIVIKTGDYKFAMRQ
jgi:hypothetical protein